jgi:hypothetical protein
VLPGAVAGAAPGAGAELAGTTGDAGAETAGVLADEPSPSRSLNEESVRITGVRFINSLSVPEPEITGLLDVSTALSAASSISEVLRPSVVTEPMALIDDAPAEMVASPCPSGRGVTPEPLTAAAATAEVALSPAPTGRPATTRSLAFEPVAVDDPVAVVPLAASCRGADDKEGGVDDNALAAASPPALPDTAPAPNAARPIPIDPKLSDDAWLEPEADRLLAIFMAASRPATSDSVNPLLPESITSLPLAALMLPGSTRPVTENTASMPLVASETMPALPALMPRSPAMTTSPLVWL